MSEMTGQFISGLSGQSLFIRLAEYFHRVHVCGVEPVGAELVETITVADAVTELVVALS